MRVHSEGQQPGREVAAAVNLLKSNRDVARAGSAEVLTRVQLARAASLIEADLRRRGQLK